jgi:myo-inositol-1(or 4)-monophosphatase
MYEASKGKGAYLDGKPLRPSAIQNLDMAVVSFIKGHYTYSDDTLKARSLDLELEIGNNVRRKLNMWAPALDWCLAASGSIDGLVSYESELEDQYAGTLIAMEAGMNVTDFKGNPYTAGMKQIIASGDCLYEQLLKITSKYV